MNIKRIFGAILTVLGIIGIIYAGLNYIQNSQHLKTLIVVGVIGIIFFIAGIGLVKKTKDKAEP